MRRLSSLRLDTEAHAVREDAVMLIAHPSAGPKGRGTVRARHAWQHIRENGMYKHILVAIDLSEDGGWRRPLLAGAEHARRFGAELTVLTVLREVEAIVRAQVA